MEVFDANSKIVEYMRKTGVLLQAEDFQHSYPHTGAVTTDNLWCDS